MKTRSFSFCGVLFLCMAGLLLGLPLPAHAAWTDGLYQDVGAGYRGDLVVTTTIRDGQITDVMAQNRAEPADEYLQTALNGLLPSMIEHNGVSGIDVVTGATLSSQGILEGVHGALQQASAPPLTEIPQPNTPEGMPPQAGTTPADENPAPSTNAQVFAGFGSVPTFRVGPGKDANQVPVYSFNLAVAQCLFDAKGRILDVFVDVYEVATPNYDGAGMPHFSGWPARQGYNITDVATGQVTGVSMNTEQNIAEEVEAWSTKRERGDTYGMNPTREWHQQMDAFQRWMRGKTTAELRAWFAKYTSPRNGRPLKQGSDQPEDQAALAALSDEEKAQLADVVSQATMSLSDAHGHLLEAIEKAYENRRPVEDVGPLAK